MRPIQLIASALILLGALASTPAYAACAYSFSSFSNGDPANATQVMGNFNYILNCPNFLGNVGINTSIPNYAGYGAGSFVQSIYGTGQPAAVLELVSGTSVTDGVVVGDVAFENTNLTTAKRLALIRSTLKGAAPNDAGGQLDFFTKTNGGNLAVAMTITNTGKVGIGTDSPGFGIDVETATGNTPAKFGNTRPIYLINDSPIVGFNLLFNNGWVFGKGSSSSYGGAIVYATSTGSMDFFTSNSAGNAGATAAVTSRMTLTQAGRLGIGTTSPGQALEVNGQIKVNSLASASGTGLCINASVISSCSSSRRYKEDIRDAGFGLNQIMAMRPVTFKWKGRDERDFGLIAEEVAKIDPRYVTYKDGKIEGVKYPQLTAVLVNAVKELKAINDRQAAEIVRLHAQNAELAANMRDVRGRLGVLEHRMIIHTAENLAPVRH